MQARVYSALRNCVRPSEETLTRENFRASDASEWELNDMVNSVEPLARIWNISLSRPLRRMRNPVSKIPAPITACCAIGFARFTRLLPFGGTGSRSRPDATYDVARASGGHRCDSVGMYGKHLSAKGLTAR